MVIQLLLLWNCKQKIVAINKTSKTRIVKSHFGHVGPMQSMEYYEHSCRSDSIKKHH